MLNNKTLKESLTKPFESHDTPSESHQQEYDSSIPRDKSHMSSIKNATKNLFHHETDDDHPHEHKKDHLHGGDDSNATSSGYYNHKKHPSTSSTNEYDNLAPSANYSGKLANENYSSMVDPVISEKDVAESEKRLHDFTKETEQTHGTAHYHNADRNFPDTSKSTASKDSSDGKEGILHKIKSIGSKKSDDTGSGRQEHMKESYPTTKEHAGTNYDASRSMDIKSRDHGTTFGEDTYNTDMHRTTSEMKKHTDVNSPLDYRHQSEKLKDVTSAAQQTTFDSSNINASNKLNVSSIDRADPDINYTPADVSNINVKRKMSDNVAEDSDSRKYSGANKMNFDKDLAATSYDGHSATGLKKGADYRGTGNEESENKHSDEQHHGVWDSLTNYLGMGSAKTDESGEQEHADATGNLQQNWDRSNDVDMDTAGEQMPGSFDYPTSQNFASGSMDKSADHPTKLRTTQDFNDYVTKKEADKSNADDWMNQDKNRELNTFKTSDAPINTKGHHQMKHDVTNDLVTESTPYRMVQNPKNEKYLKSEDSHDLKVDKKMNKSNSSELAAAAANFALYGNSKTESKDLPPSTTSNTLKGSNTEGAKYGHYNEPDFDYDDKLDYDNYANYETQLESKAPTSNIHTLDPNAKLHKIAESHDYNDQTGSANLNTDRGGAIAAGPLDSNTQNESLKPLGQAYGYYAGTHTKADMPGAEFLPTDQGKHDNDETEKKLQNLNLNDEPSMMDAKNAKGNHKHSEKESHPNLMERNMHSTSPKQHIDYDQTVHGYYSKGQDEENLAKDRAGFEEDLKHDENDEGTGGFVGFQSEQSKNKPIQEELGMKATETTSKPSYTPRGLKSQDLKTKVAAYRKEAKNSRHGVSGHGVSGHGTGDESGYHPYTSESAMGSGKDSNLQSSETEHHDNKFKQLFSGNKDNKPKKDVAKKEIHSRGTVYDDTVSHEGNYGYTSNDQPAMGTHEMNQNIGETSGDKYVMQHGGATSDSNVIHNTEESGHGKNSNHHNRRKSFIDTIKDAF